MGLQVRTNDGLQSHVALACCWRILCMHQHTDVHRHPTVWNLAAPMTEGRICKWRVRSGTFKH